MHKVHCGPRIKSPYTAVRTDGQRPITARHRKLLPTPPASSSAQASSSQPLSEGEASRRKVWLGRVLLLLVAATYGTLGVTFKTLYLLPGPPSASVLSATRGMLTTVCFLPVMWQTIRETRKQPGLWKAALILAVCNAGTMGLINVGLLHTEATRAAFLAQTSVCMTPMIQMLSRERVPWTTWLGSGMCLTGVVLIMIGRSASDVTSSIMHSALNHGDLLCLGGAFFFAIYCVRVGIYSKRGFPTASLYACKNLLLAGVYASWVMLDTARLTLSAVSNLSFAEHLASLWPGWSNPFAWILLAFSAVVPGALADYFQAKGQESIPASEANIILCTDPLWAALFATLWLSESLTPIAWCGGALIVSASLTATFGTTESLH